MFESPTMDKHSIRKSKCPIRKNFLFVTTFQMVVRGKIEFFFEKSETTSNAQKIDKSNNDNDKK